jgi:hypothetical protein
VPGVGGLHGSRSMAVTAGGRPAWLPSRPGLVAWWLWALVVLGLAALPWFDRLLRLAGRADLIVFDLAGVPLVLAIVSTATVGAVLASRRPRHPVGWLLLALGLSVSASGLGDVYVRYGLLARPGTLPAAGYLAHFLPLTFPLGYLVCTGFVLLLTPTGSLPSPRWRWWARTAAAAPVIVALWLVFGSGVAEPPYPPVPSPLAIDALAGPLEVAGALAFLIIVLAVLVGAGSLVLRFRRARGVERQQLRWVALAAAQAPLVALVILARRDSASLFVGAVGVYLALLSMAIGAAILRYRLYDLDRIISRTLAYGVLTLLLGGGYAGAVLVLGQLFGVGERTPGWAVAGATLAVAALFQPARRRIQQAVDRRFNRRKYHAAQTIQAFSTRLREQIDLDTLSAELLAVVDQTVAPTRVWFWLPPSPHGSSGTARSEARTTPWAY